MIKYALKVDNSPKASRPSPKKGRQHGLRGLGLIQTLNFQVDTKSTKLENKNLHLWSTFTSLISALAIHDSANRIFTDIASLILYENILKAINTWSRKTTSNEVP